MCQDQGYTYIFAYGSLIWRPGFAYTRRFVAYVKGYERVFYQLCRHHRGTAEAPGRVVTIIPCKANASSRVYGVCYCISNEQRDEVLSALDWRERGGYIRLQVPIFVDGIDESIPVLQACVLYCGGLIPGSEDFIDESQAELRSLESLSQVIATSVGASGPNREYLFNLARVLREELKVHDEHVFELERRVRDLVASSQQDVSNTVMCLASKSNAVSIENAIVVDDGAAIVLSSGKAKGLLPVGVVDVRGTWPRGNRVCIVDTNNKLIAHGTSNYSSEEILQIKGRHSRLIPKLLAGRDVDCRKLHETPSLQWVVPVEKLF